MADVKTSYTLEEFIEWLHRILVVQGVLYDFLGWTPDSGHYDDVVQETLIACGVEDIADLDGLAAVKMLRTVGRFKLWTQVQEAVATEHTFSADGSSYSRSDIFSQVSTLLERAAAAADLYLGTWTITPVTITDSEDPYVWDSGDEWTV